MQDQIISFLTYILLIKKKIKNYVKYWQKQCLEETVKIPAILKQNKDKGVQILPNVYFTGKLKSIKKK